MENPAIDKPLIRSFGRIKSRKLSNHKNSLYDELLPQYEIKDFDNLEITAQDVAARKPKKVCLEIGFGFGDYTFENAKSNPNTLFFASEPHINGVVNLLSKLEQEPLNNLKVTCEDARLLLEKFSDQTFDQVLVLFPDPWPKSRHFKRRLIQAEFLDQILSPKMKKGAILTIATDHDLYKTWILSEVYQSREFTWDAKSKKDWKVFPADWVETKYQKKAAREGRDSVIFNLIKNG